MIGLIQIFMINHICKKSGHDKSTFILSMYGTQNYVIYSSSFFIISCQFLHNND